MTTTNKYRFFCELPTDTYNEVKRRITAYYNKYYDSSFDDDITQGIEEHIDRFMNEKIVSVWSSDIDNSDGLYLADIIPYGTFY